MAEIVAGILAWVDSGPRRLRRHGDRDRGDRVGGPQRPALAASAGRGRRTARAGGRRRSCGSTTPSTSSTSRSGLSGALYGGGAPASLRRARLTRPARARRGVRGVPRRSPRPDASPVEIRRVVRRASSSAAPTALATISAARAEHAGWVRANVSAAAQVAAARRRLEALRATMGDPAALVAELSSRFAEDEWRDASRAASRRRRRGRRGGAVARRRGADRRRPDAAPPSPTSRPPSARCAAPRPRRARSRRPTASSPRPRRRCPASSPPRARRCGRPS